MKAIRSLHFEIGGYDAMNHMVDYRNGFVKYAKYYHPYRQEVKEKEITVDEIMLLTTKLYDLGIQKWEKEYTTPVCDGIQWELKINYENGFRKKVWGSNAYPNQDKEDDMEYSTDFEKLLSILSDFIGAPSFFV